MQTETHQDSESSQKDQLERALTALKQVTATLRQKGNTKELIQEALMQIVNAMDWAAGSIYLTHQGGIALLTHHSLTDRAITWKKRLSMGKSLAESSTGDNEPHYQSRKDWLPADLPFEAPEDEFEMLAHVPLLARDAGIGQLFLVTSETSPRNPMEADILTAIGHQMAHAVALAQLLVGESRARRMAGTLREVAQTISSSLDRDQVLNLILEKLGDVIAYDTASVMLVCEDHFDVLFARDRHGKEKSVAIQTPVQRRAAAWQVVHNGDPIVLTDVRDSDLWTDVPQLSYIRSWIGVPLKIRNQVIGVLTLDKTEPGFYQPSQVPMLVAFASQAAAAIENARLYGAAQQALAERIMLHEVSQAVSSSLELEAVLNAVTDAAIRATEAQRGYLVLREESEEALQFLSARDSDRETLQGDELVVSRSIAHRVLAAGEPVLTVNAQEDPRFADQSSVIHYSLRSVVCVPLVSKNQTIGALYVDHRLRDGQFTHRSLEMLENVAAQAATAVENALLYKQLRETNSQLAEALEESQRSYEKLRTTQEKLVRAKKREAMIEMAGAAAHELNQPLTVIEGISNLLQDHQVEDEELERDLRAIVQAARRASKIVKKMAEASRYETRDYAGGDRIVDLDRAKADKEDPERTKDD